MLDAIEQGLEPLALGGGGAGEPHHRAGLDLVAVRLEGLGDSLDRGAGFVPDRREPPLTVVPTGQPSARASLGLEVHCVVGPLEVVGDPSGRREIRRSTDRGHVARQPEEVPRAVAPLVRARLTVGDLLVEQRVGDPPEQIGHRPELALALGEVAPGERQPGARRGATPDQAQEQEAHGPSRLPR